MRNARTTIINEFGAKATSATRWWGRLGILCLIIAVTAMVSPAQNEQTSTDAVKFTTLVNFDGTNGSFPGDLVQGFDGNLYGPTFFGDNFNGNIFKISPSGTLTNVYNFCSQTNCADGANPNIDGPLALDTDGNFYGTTGSGGANTWGTIFRITPGGTLTTLYNFCSNCNVTAGVVRGADGNFYGTSAGGGVNNNSGSVYKITPQGEFTALYSFCAQTNCTDGQSPYAALLAASDGNFYGLTGSGGANGYGTAFRITPVGTLTTLYSFDANSYCYFSCEPLIQAANGNFYGTSYYGGTGAACTQSPGCGTVYEITPSGAFSVLYNFCSQTNCADGSNPYALMQATDGDFYGSTQFNASGSADGAVFKLTPGGSLTILHNFDGTDGYNPASLTQGTNGTLYGTTENGGSNDSCNLGCGTVFSLSVGLGPFVETLPTSGRVGETIKILGNRLADATGVSFNGVAATFKVASHTLLSATVPTGATTGYVTVTTPSGTLKSNVKFQVRP